MDCLSVSTWKTVLFDCFLSESDFKARTRMTFLAGLKNFTAWCLEREISVPDTGTVRQWKTFLLDHYRTATARTYLASVKLFLKWLSIHHGCQDIGLPIKGVQAEQDFQKNSLSDRDMKRILAHLEKRVQDASGKVGHQRIGKKAYTRLPDQAKSGYVRALRDYVVVLLITTCGLRVSEVSSLDIGDLDTVHNVPVLWVHGKGRDGKSDFVPIPPELRRQLIHYFQHTHVSANGVSSTEPMFVSYSRNSHGKRLSARTISGIVKEAMVDAGFNSARLTAHSLRHTAVTLALQAGASVQQVQQFARHRLYEMTLRYAHNLEHSANPCSRLVMKMIGRLNCSGTSQISRAGDARKVVPYLGT